MLFDAFGFSLGIVKANRLKGAVMTSKKRSTRKSKVRKDTPAQQFLAKLEERLKEWARLKPLDIVVLLEDLSSQGVCRDEWGIVMKVCENDTYEVDFFDRDSKVYAKLTLRRAQLRLQSRNERPNPLRSPSPRDLIKFRKASVFLNREHLSREKIRFIIRSLLHQFKQTMAMNGIALPEAVDEWIVDEWIVWGHATLDFSGDIVSSVITPPNSAVGDKQQDKIVYRFLSSPNSAQGDEFEEQEKLVKGIVYRCYKVLRIQRGWIDCDVPERSSHQFWDEVITLARGELPVEQAWKNEEDAGKRALSAFKKMLRMYCRTTFSNELRDRKNNRPRPSPRKRKR